MASGASRTIIKHKGTVVQKTVKVKPSGNPPNPMKKGKGKK